MYNITFQQIETFLTVAEHLNLSDAAETLFLSQSSVSKTIRRFEDGLGLVLFERKNRGLALTKEGEDLYSKLRIHYSDICKDIQITKDLKTKTHQVIRIGYPSTYDSSEDYDKLKQIINDYANKHPEIELNEDLFDFRELRQALTFGYVDIAFSPDFILNDIPDISQKKVLRSRSCLAMSAKHPLAMANSLKEIDFEELKKEVFYTVPLNNELNNKKEAFRRLEKYGIRPCDVQFASNFQSLLRVIRRGRGMSLCGYFPNAPGHEEIKYFTLPPSDDDPILMATWKTNSITKEVRNFIEILPDDPEGMTVFKH
ncbi:DNA-binding transcriptional regulator, LysR family [Sporobacter termitidis DSM 10068]|uniref:DNA-binding transcriptional regulator, LysR family n=1 Tax=Sporobacter termitidis DSM 10068 TaxID=1123282 RepID=A0A1M5ZCW8_9FIRM|nr:LysR family transcriptional regulator [Sporobacter termitidis]SHI22019.1 DNA-binding transcriptional regulator, LysR family [Sporobacter termitidis DSM 10068]